MKKVFQKLTCLIIALLAVSCTGNPSGNSSSNAPSSSSAPSSQPSSSSSSSARPSSSSSARPSSSSSVCEHVWSEEYSYNSASHWQVCTLCGLKNTTASHEFVEWEATSTSSLKAAAPYKSANARIKGCKHCNYHLFDGDVLPQVRFTFSKSDPNANFATVATKNDLSRPKVAGTIDVTNCDAKYQITGASATMKVRGNQTAGWSKKAFKIKFDKAQSMLGLHGEKAYKEWVLLADAKDTTLIRSALGFYISQGVAKDDEQVWVSEFTPVTVYLNDEYWGFYYLAEQKEVKTGRVTLPIPSNRYEGVDIGYCFELDHYADSAGSQGEASEMAKGADGDPTFRVKYSPRMEQGRPSGPLATGQVNTYTMLSDITDGPISASGDPSEHWQADYTNVNGQGQLSSSSKKTSNSNQLTFIRGRVEALYQVLYEAAVNKTAKDINENNEVISSTKSVEQAVKQHFDLDAWVDGYIINAYTVAPDLGYSSFYMSFDNSPSGDKKLRYDVPWDFDSNFGNRNNFYVNAEGDTYVDNTYNTWLYLLSKLDFFLTMVKAKWNKIRDEQLFEGMFKMMRTYFADFDCEIKKNHKKWPQNDAAHQPPNNFDEIREPYKDPAKYKDAEEETISWCAKRVNFLESKWGKGRASVKTN